MVDSDHLRRTQEHCADALMMEAFVCKEGRQFARQCRKEFTWKPIVWSLFGFFEGFSISPIRECNRVAHEVGWQVSSTIRFRVWHREAPTRVQELLEQDCNNLR